MERNTQEITQTELAKALDIIRNIQQYYESKVVGQSYLGYSILISLMTNGHILLESVPGLAKTTAAKVMTEAVDGSFSRIQCTPDLLPSDIIGTETYQMATNTFDTKLGPVNANFVLLDEVNRSVPRHRVPCWKPCRSEKSASVERPTIFRISSW